MYKTIIALVLLAAVANAQLVGWRNCGSHMATVHRIRVSGCSQAPCTVVIGTTIRIEVDATALANSNNLPFAMTGQLFGVPITLLEGNACQNLSLGSCPALIGNHFTFGIDYPVTNLLPPIATVVTSTVWNDFGDVGICIQVDINIVTSLNDVPEALEAPEEVLDEQ